MRRILLIVFILIVAAAVFTRYRAQRFSEVQPKAEASRGVDQKNQNTKSNQPTACQTGPLLDEVKKIAAVTNGPVGTATTATNDIGIVTLPDGRHLAIAVFVSETKANETTGEEVIAKIAAAAWTCWTRK